jgi:hypothetical protein
MLKPACTNETKKAQQEILWGLYQECRTHVRHIETLRSNATNYILVISSALVTVIISDERINSRDLPLSIMIASLGFFGALFCVSYTVEFNRHRLRASEIRRQLDKMFFPTEDGVEIKRLRDEAESKNSSYFGFALVRRVARTHLFWIVLPSAVCVTGLCLSVIAVK